MIKGIYRIFKNGLEVASQENLVTNNGKDMILKYLGSSVSSWAADLVVGTGSSLSGSTNAAKVTDTILEYEVVRNIIKLRSPNIMTSTATYSSVSANTVVVTLPTGFSSGTVTIGTVTSNTATLTGLSSTAGMIVGGRVTATNGTGNIGVNTVITSVLGPTSITVSSTASLAAGNVTAIGSSYIVSGMAVSGTNIDVNSVITSVSSTATTVSVVLSHTPTSTPSGTMTFTQRKLIFKTDIDPTVVTTIKEIGLFSGGLSANGNYSEDILTNFEEGVSGSGSPNPLTWYNATTPTNYSSVSYVGSSSLRLANTNAVLGSTNATPTRPGVLNKLITSYDRTDTLKLLVYNASGSATTGTIKVTFYDTQNSVTTMVWSIASATYGIGSLTVLSAPMNDATVVTNSAFNYNISAIKVETTADLVFDSLKISPDSKINANNSLLSRTILTTPISKTVGDNLEIQYELVLGL